MSTETELAMYCLPYSTFFPNAETCKTGKIRILGCFTWHLWLYFNWVRRISLKTTNVILCKLLLNKNICIPVKLSQLLWLEKWPAKPQFQLIHLKPSANQSTGFYIMRNRVPKELGVLRNFSLKYFHVVFFYLRKKMLSEITQ